MSNTQATLLGKYQYCHILNKNTGEQRLIEGPSRTHLEGHEDVVGDIKSKIRLSDQQFIVIRNPFDHESKQIKEGEQELRVGPAVFSIHPGEIAGHVQNEFVLTDSQALLLKAQRDAPHPLDETKILKAGEKILLKGPARYIPHVHISVESERKSISLSQNQGVYIQNDDTGRVRLVKGPDDFFLEHNESLWEKWLTEEESQALGYEKQSLSEESRILTSQPQTRDVAWDAVVIELEDNEAIYIYDDANARVEFGPQTLFLEPHERPKVLFVSGDVPVRINVLRIARLGLGPDFIRDRLNVRTKDNATLELDITFRWRFLVDAENPKKLFALKDFVGFTAQTLSAEIREAAAKHTFDEFHSRAGEIIKQAVFAKSSSRVFTENNLEVFGVDVEGITPEDDEIRKRLATAIKTNVDIYTERVQQEARLDSERRLIEGQAKNEGARKELIELRLTNERRDRLETAKTEAQTIITHAKAEAQAIGLRAEAERKAEEDRLRAITAALSGAGGSEYIALEQARFGHNARKVFVVPTDARVHVGIDRPNNALVDAEDLSD